MAVHSVIVVDEQGLSLDEIAAACGLGKQWIMTLVEADILPVNTPEQSAWRFESLHLSRARRAFRLHRDFDASLTAVSLMLDLLEEVEQLRKVATHQRRDQQVYVLDDDV